MKTAIIWFGFFRNFNHCYKTMLNDVIEPLNADIYFHSYETIYTPKNMEAEGMHWTASINDDKLSINDLQQKLNNRIKSYEIEQYDSNQYHQIVSDFNLPEKNMVGQLHWRVLSTNHSLHKSINHFINNRKDNYDLIVLTRPDIRSLRLMNISMLNLDQISYSYPEGRAVTPDHLRGPADFPHYVEDQLLVMSQSNLEKLKDLFPTVIEFAKNGITLCNEAILGRYYEKHNIKFGPCDFHFHDIWRKNEPIK